MAYRHAAGAMDETLMDTNSTQQQDPQPRMSTAEEPLDAANQSLADALRSSFGVLKGIMAVLFVLYLASNVRSIDTHEEALILRLGKLKRVVDQPGLVWAFPFPLDEIVPLPTKKSNDILIDSHTFRRRPDEVGRPLSTISRGMHAGLHPTLDGALLTADAGLVHTQWKVTYKFHDVRSFVGGIAGDTIDAAEKLIRVLVETVGIGIASEMTAEEMIRTRVDYVQHEMKRRIGQRLLALNSGIELTLVEIYEPTPPIQIRKAFDNTQAAENRKRQRIRAAEKERTTILNGAAGASHSRLVRLLDDIDRGGSENETLEQLRGQLDRMLDEEVEGDAGRRLKEAGAYRATAVSQMESDVKRYRTLLPEYKRNPRMLFNRLWEETKQQIFESPGVTKVYRPPGLKEFRLKIARDPEETRLEEERRLQKKKFDPRTLRPEHLDPLGPEHD